MTRNPVVLIIGPTGVGKTEIAIELAGHLNGEIVSADSRLFYVGMDIGTAKPTAEQRRLVPHHLIDIAPPDHVVSLAEFQEAARAAIAAIHARGRLPLIVGGTGQYARALAQGWVPPQVKPDARLRSALEGLRVERGADWLHARLRHLDAPAADAIDPRNARRTMRAMEVIFTTGRRFSDLRSRKESNYRLMVVGLRRPRDELYSRIDARVEEMFQRGLLDEVRNLLSRGYTADLPSMSAIGYRESSAVLQGELNLEAAKGSMRKATRVLVRRQASWFRSVVLDATWFDVDDAVTERVARHLREQLGQTGN